MSDDALRILHVSDTHGAIAFERIEQTFGDDFDVFCHTGDWLPDPPMRSQADLICYQMEWLRHEGPALAAYLRGRPFVACLGNHDALSEAWVERELGTLGVQATLPGSRPNPRVSVAGGTFLGCRYVPFMGGAFEGECTAPELVERVLHLSARWYPDDILLAHCPPQGALAGPPDRAWGNAPLADSLRSSFGDLAPRLILCGHIHECPGSERIGQTTVINSARSVSRIRWKKRVGVLEYQTCPLRR